MSVAHLGIANVISTPFEKFSSGILPRRGSSAKQVNTWLGIPSTEQVFSIDELKRKAPQHASVVEGFVVLSAIRNFVLSTGERKFDEEEAKIMKTVLEHPKLQHSMAKVLTDIVASNGNHFRKLSESVQVIPLPQLIDIKIFFYLNFLVTALENPAPKVEVMIALTSMVLDLVKSKSLNITYRQFLVDKIFKEENKKYQGKSIGKNMEGDEEHGLREDAVTFIALVALMDQIKEGMTFSHEFNIMPGPDPREKNFFPIFLETVLSKLDGQSRDDCLNSYVAKLSAQVREENLELSYLLTRFVNDSQPEAAAHYITFLGDLDPELFRSTARRFTGPLDERFRAKWAEIIGEEPPIEENTDAAVVEVVNDSAEINEEVIEDSEASSSFAKVPPGFGESFGNSREYFLLSYPEALNLAIDKGEIASEYRGFDHSKGITPAQFVAQKIAQAPPASEPFNASPISSSAFAPAFTVASDNRAPSNLFSGLGGTQAPNQGTGFYQPNPVLTPQTSAYGAQPNPYATQTPAAQPSVYATQTPAAQPSVYGSQTPGTQPNPYGSQTPGTQPNPYGSQTPGAPNPYTNQATQTPRYGGYIAPQASGTQTTTPQTSAYGGSAYIPPQAPGTQTPAAQLNPYATRTPAAQAPGYGGYTPQAPGTQTGGYPAYPAQTSGTQTGGYPAYSAQTSGTQTGGYPAYSAQTSAYGSQTPAASNPYTNQATQAPRYGGYPAPPTQYPPR